MTDTVAGIDIPDTALVTEATELVREAANPLIYHYSRRVFLFGSLRARHQKLAFDAELLYVGAMFHDLGLTTKYRRADQRFEIDGADEERAAVVASHPRLHERDPRCLHGWTPRPPGYHVRQREGRCAGTLRSRLRPG